MITGTNEFPIIIAPILGKKFGEKPRFPAKNQKLMILKKFKDIIDKDSDAIQKELGQLYSGAS